VTVWINGRPLPDDEARISVFDHGLAVGDAVFETVKVAAGVPFAFSRHLEGRRYLRGALSGTA
jgi:branched-chain amino acid aminotransferase